MEAMCQECLTVATALIYLSLTVPGTYEFSRERWQNKSWGFFDLDRTVEKGVVKIGADGSRATRVAYRSYREYFFLKSSWSFETIYRAGEHVSFVVVPQAQKTGVVMCVEQD